MGQDPHAPVCFQLVDRIGIAQVILKAVKGDGRRGSGGWLESGGKLDLRVEGDH